MKHFLTGIVLIAGISGLVEPSVAKVVKFEVLRVESPAFEGRKFGTVGTYDRIIARATIAVSPNDPHNSMIVDIDRAPRNTRDLVEAVSDVEILLPTIHANGNRRLLYEVLNRGTKLGPALFNDSSASTDPAKPTDDGNGFLLNHGFTLVWSGWQGDVPVGSGRLTFAPPTVPDVTGLSREEFIFDHTESPASAPLSYPAADLDPSRAKLTVRERVGDPRVAPADLSFNFEGANKISINRPAGFDAGAIYEFVYLAKDPKVMGLGFAATRDIVSFLRNERTDTNGGPNVLAGTIDHAIGIGVSQSGRYLHDFLYLGFNTDEADRPVFDGLMPHIAGGKKTFINYRFGQPGRNVQQHAEALYPGGDFPFTYPVITDPLSGRTDGFLARCIVAGNCPKIIQTDTELEFYQSFASLVTTDTQGNALAMPDNVRLFLLSNLQHFARANTKSGMTKICAFPSNPLHAGPPMRALLVALDKWITDGTSPPASRYPSRADSTLVPSTQEAVGFPNIPGHAYTGTVNRAALAKDVAYPVFVPKTDADGRDLAGLRLPTVEAPVATYTGWNLRKTGFSEGELCDLVGTMLPFAGTREERLKNNDPRPSIAERYPTESDRAAAIVEAAKRLVQDKLLLEEDTKLYTAAIN